MQRLGKSFVAEGKRSWYTAFHVEISYQNARQRTFKTHIHIKDY